MSKQMQASRKSDRFMYHLRYTAIGAVAGLGLFMFLLTLTWLVSDSGLDWVLS